MEMQPPSWIDVSQAIGGLATAAALFVIWFQARMTSRQTHIMEEQLGRAWIGPGSDIRTGQKISVNFNRLILHCKNYGQQPAEILWTKSIISNSEVTESIIRATSESPTDTIIFPNYPGEFQTGSDINIPVRPPQEVVIWFGFIVRYLVRTKDEGEYGIIGKFHFNLVGSWPEQTKEWYKPSSG